METLSRVTEEIETSQEPLVEQASTLEGLGYWRIAAVVMVGIFAVGLPQPLVLGYLPIFKILMFDLHRDQTSIAFFFFVIGSPFYFKPLGGVLSDCFPILNSKRRHYILLFSSIATVAWIALLIVPKTYSGLMIGCLIISAFIMATSSTVGGVLVEAGRQLRATGRFTSFRIVSENVATALQYVLGAGLTLWAFNKVITLNAALVALLIPVVYFCLREKELSSQAKYSVDGVRTSIRTLFHSKTFGLAALACGLFYFAPGMFTVLQTRIVKVYGFTTGSMGLLMAVSCIVAVLTSIAYVGGCKRSDLTRIAVIGVLLNAECNFLFLLYTPVFAHDAWIQVASGLTYTLCELSLLTIAARSVPRGSEAVGYGFIISMRIAAGQIGNVIGAAVSEHLPFWQLLALNSITTLFVLTVLPFLPKSIMAREQAADAQAHA